MVDLLQQTVNDSAKPLSHDTLNAFNKRTRDDYEGSFLQADGEQLLGEDHDEGDGDEEDGAKKAKLDDMDDMDGGETLPLGGTVPGSDSGGLGYFTNTGNIKSPIFEGIPSLTPEWLLKKVWLKVNGDMDQTVLASLISKDMGPKLRQEIRLFLEKRGQVHSGNRINLKNTIMQAVEITITYQKEKPTLTIVRDPKQRPRKEGKGEKNFNIALTPFGYSICMNDLQLKKRDAFTQKMPSKLGMTIPMGMGMTIMSTDPNHSSNNINNQISNTNNNINNTNNNINLSNNNNISSIPTSAPISCLMPPTPVPVSHQNGIGLNVMNLAWKPMPSLKDMEELAKRNIQVTEAGGQLFVTMKDELNKRDLIIQELRNIILELKPTYSFPPHLLLPPDTIHVEILDHTHALHTQMLSSILNNSEIKMRGW